jgi:hypothetical protein
MIALSQDYIIAFFLSLFAMLNTSTALFTFQAKSKPVASSSVYKLIEAATRPQSSGNRQLVESLIKDLSNEAKANKKYCKPISAGSYRTVWTSVTAASPIGVLKRDKPSVVLGGQSWQVINKSLNFAENVVFWPNFFGIRMAGLARINPIVGKAGYHLAISGLEFRRSDSDEEPIPEKYGKMGDTLSGFRVLSLKPTETLSNGVGTLEVLFNDGTFRITKDTTQDNTYIHIKEPVASSVLELID